MNVHDEPPMAYGEQTIPRRTWIELDDDEVQIAVRMYAEANGVSVPYGMVELRQRDHRGLNGIAMIVQHAESASLWAHDA